MRNEDRLLDLRLFYMDEYSKFKVRDGEVSGLGESDYWVGKAVFLNGNKILSPSYVQIDRPCFLFQVESYLFLEFVDSYSESYKSIFHSVSLIEITKVFKRFPRACLLESSFDYWLNGITRSSSDIFFQLWNRIQSGEGCTISKQTKMAHFKMEKGGDLSFGIRVDRNSFMIFSYLDGLNFKKRYKWKSSLAPNLGNQTKKLVSYYGET